MRKIFIPFIIFPIFSFSQMLLEDVKLECLYEKDSTDCYKTLKGSKIYIENNHIIFDVVVSKEKFKILNKYVVDSGETYYDIDYNGEMKTVFKHDYEDGTFGVFVFGDSSRYLVYK